MHCSVLIGMLTAKSSHAELSLELLNDSPLPLVTSATCCRHSQTSVCVLGAGGSMRPEDVRELQRVAEQVSAIAERRAAFLALFLEPS